MADTMRALTVTRHGGAEVVEIHEAAVPEPGDGQVLIEVAASGVNFKDVYMREGVYPSPTPFTLGDECSGHVVAVGSGVTDLAVGDLVVTASTVTGGHASHAVVDAAVAVPVPDGVDAETAAAVLLQGMTAHYLVHSTYAVSPGDVILAHAAAGGVGQLLVQMAKALGATVITTVGSASKVAIATAVGADHVIRYDEVDDLAAAVRAIAPDGVHAVYDGVGKATFEASLASLGVRGTLALYGAASGQVPPFDLQRLNPAGSLFVTRPTLAHYMLTRAELLHRSGEVLTAVADGSLRVAIGGRYPLAEASRAYADLESRASTGKLLLIP